MSYIKFKPWVGCNYETGGVFAKKILVLGESHYSEEQNRNPKPNFTIDVIDEYVKDYFGAGYQQTFYCFAKAVMGKEELSEEERAAFWHSVVFYNYVQQYQSGPRQPLNLQESDKTENESAFQEVLETCMPDCIIVWGKRLYSMMPYWNGRGDTLDVEVFDSDGSKTKIGSASVWIYPIKGKEIPALCVSHPSTPVGKMRGYWHLFYKRFLNL